MEKSTKTIDVYKTKTVKKKTGEKQVEIFTARDGREFTTESGCLKHETELNRIDKFNSIKKIQDGSTYRFPETWYFISDEEELEMIKNMVGFYDNYNYVHINDEDKNKDSDILKIGDWIGSYNFDGGDYRGDVYIYTLEYLSKKFMKILKEAKLMKV